MARRHSTLRSTRRSNWALMAIAGQHVAIRALFEGFGLQPNCNPTPDHWTSPDGLDGTASPRKPYSGPLDGLNDTRCHGVCVTTDQKVGGSSPSGRATRPLVLQGVSAIRGYLQRL